MVRSRWRVGPIEVLLTMQITYQDTTDGIGSDNLKGFFVGWPNPPSPEAHLRILKGSDYVVLAVSSEGKVIGFISAISDGVSCAYIPHLEVLPEWQGKGIGSDLVRRMVRKLKDLYMIDLICDQQVQRFYERLGFEKAPGMIVRNFGQQACD